MSAPMLPKQVKKQNTMRDFLLSLPCVMKRQMKLAMHSAIARQILIRKRLRSAFPMYRGTRKNANEANDQVTIMIIRLLR